MRRSAEGERRRALRLTVTGKGRKQRLVPVLPAVREAVADYLAVGALLHGDRDGPLFLGVRGDRLHPRVVQRACRTAAPVAGAARDGHAPCAAPQFRHPSAGRPAAISAPSRSCWAMPRSTTQRYTDVDAAALLAVYDKAHPAGASAPRPGDARNEPQGPSDRRDPRRGRRPRRRADASITDIVLSRNRAPPRSGARPPEPLGRL